ncbi:glycosyl hydrolase family 18 protein [Edaphobacillus lindanitolerans]|uniref:Spore germination protein n=1 Tax=Edaphobacillus lindanitolerans TaxID=550447 RepID=A0A1U7PUB4_9BACI|nr:glycosyl hydrolase family 18 protein [Edaphobacillus lindanitolerans]SIT93471.1 spore germination protein [Edaphobacillus lindanitolerans]
MIHVVKSGESLFTIARRYDTNSATLAAVNELPDPDVLVVGQALYIPQTPDPDRRTIETNAYAEWYTAEPPASLMNEIRKRGPELTYIMPFAYEVRRNGSLVPFSWGDIGEAAARQGASTAIVIVNIEEGGFSDTLAEALFDDPAAQDRMIREIIAMAKEKGAKDVHVDFEYLGRENREKYTAFLRKLKNGISPEGLTLSVALPPKTSAEQPGKWYEGHDYAAIGNIADFVVVMTYEWGYSGGPPMAVSPIGPVRDVLEFAVSVIPANKVHMGQNLYGYDWTLPYKQGNPPARTLSPQAALALARERNAAIQYDETAQAPFFNYWLDGKEHVVWFEDARSIKAKFDLLNELKLRGISYWHLAFPFPQNWQILSQMFHVKKL